MLVVTLLLMIVAFTVYSNLTTETQVEIKTTFKNIVNEIRTWWAK